MKNDAFYPNNRVFIISSASVAGQKEKAGPLGSMFDLSGDDRFGKDTWEKSEAEMQRLALSISLNKASIEAEEIDMVFAGDLINQCISSSFGLLSFGIPFIGLFGACSTSALGMLSSSVYLSAVHGKCASVTSSHFCSAERQFRYPLEYGGQRAPTSQWTVTGAGAFVYSSDPADAAETEREYVPEIISVMPGRIVDRGIKDQSNMGAAMAPSAADTIKRFFSQPLHPHTPSEYDLIVTGDLGREGSAILLDLSRSEGLDISDRHTDCGMMIYSADEDVHAGGSGCGCSAVVLASDILENIRIGRLGRVLFAATGALMNSLSVNQKQTIPGIAHLIEIHGVKRSSL